MLLRLVLNASHSNETSTRAAIYAASHPRRSADTL